MNLWGFPASAPSPHRVVAVQPYGFLCGLYDGMMPDLSDAGAVLAAVKDACRAARRARWPAAILDGGCARRPRVVRSAR